MIKLHHLNRSRSHRILWLLEELGVDYEIVPHQRDEETRLAPPELKNIHPLGKSPVIEDDGKVYAESASIIEYLIDTYGKGKFKPAAGTDAYWRYNHFLHFAEGSAMLPLMLFMHTSRLGDAGAPLMPRIMAEMDNHLSYLNLELGDADFLVGDSLTGADIQNSFVLENPYSMGLLEQYPNLKRYVDALHARPAYQRAVEIGGSPIFS